MKLRLLIADDNIATQKMVQLAFDGEDAVVEAVSSGDAALEALKGFRPNAALVDVLMPGYSGYEVCELIRHDTEFASIPVILLNGAFDPFDEDEAARVGASGHLTKPFDPSEMIAMVERLLLKNERGAAPVFSDKEAEEAITGTVASAEISSQPTESDALVVPDDFFSLTHRSWKSFLGPDSILEIFNGETFYGKPAAEWRIPEELIDRVAEKAVKKMIPDIETFIKQTLSACKSINSQ